MLVLITLFALSSCELFEDYDKRTYFNKEATGYVYYLDTKEPAQNVQVRVSSGFINKEWAAHPDIVEDFYTDSTGFFKIRFLKRTHKQNVSGITVYAYDYNGNRPSNFISCGVNDLNNLILNLDTLWIR